MASPKNIIEQIRRKKYGVGLQTDQASAGVIKELKASLNSALEQLSQDLYSKDVHFVLELIQNAEDNNYESSAVPFLKFSIDNRNVVVQNNEVGFTADNVRALCDVGKTTKTKAQGYIGEKGIGFKSTFRVSNEPKIFSNGFNFCFKRGGQEDILGFVVPHWIDEIPEFVDVGLTNIVLSIREEAKGEMLKIREVEPTLMLFLKKLRVIEIDNKVEGTNYRIERHPIEGGKIEIMHPAGNKCRHWKLVRKSLPDMQALNEEKRKDVEATELVLAFPLNRDGSADTSEEQEVFAYLPVRSYGFKFIVQADFLVPANRKDIHEGRAWNKHLRDSVAKGFLEALVEFKIDGKLKTSFYKYIPLKEEVKDGFFCPVVGQIQDALKGTECMLTQSGSWLKPGDVLRAGTEMRELVTNDDLRHLCGKEYLSSEVEIRQGILAALGVRHFELDDLFECLEDTKWVGGKDDKWFIKLYAFLNSQALSETAMTTLKGLKLIRLEDGQLTSLSEGTIFFSLAKRGDYGFENELRVVKRSLGLDKKSNEAVSNARQFLGNLGVRDPDTYEIIEGHILPIYEGGGWKRKHDRQLLGYVRYVKDNLDKYCEEKDKDLNESRRPWEGKEDPLERIKEQLLIKCNKYGGRNHSKPSELYLPGAYGNKNDLESLFQGMADVLFVSKYYIADILKKYRIKDKPRKDKKKIAALPTRRDAQIYEWRKFFAKLGVSEGLKVKETKQSNSVWAGKNPGLWWKKGHANKTPSSDEVTDYELELLPEILKIITMTNGVTMSKTLSALLEKDWGNLSKSMERKMAMFYADSTWLHLLKETAWLPTKQGTLAKPEEVFLDSPEIRAVLGDTVHYLTFKIENSQFIEALEINSEAKTVNVINYMQNLVGKGDQDRSTFEKLYGFLNDHFSGDSEQIKEAFSGNKMILLPTTNQIYFNSREVFWKDVSNIFGESRGYLEKEWPELKSFFVDKLGISQKPVPEDYAGALMDLSKKENVSGEDERIILKIYRELDYHLNPETSDHQICEEPWWGELVDSCILWTDKGAFWKNDDNVFINDDPELYELFKNKGNMAFLKLPQNYYPRIQHFTEALRIKRVSKARGIQLEAGEEPLEESELARKIQGLVPYILRYLYFQENSIYATCVANRTLESIKFYSIEDLRVQYSLHGCQAHAQRDILIREGNLYIKRDCLQNINIMAVELAKLLGEPKGLDNFLILLFSKKTDDEIERLLRATGIGQLPEDSQFPKAEEPSQGERQDAEVPTAKKDDPEHVAPDRVDPRSQIVPEVKEEFHPKVREEPITREIPPVPPPPTPGRTGGQGPQIPYEKEGRRPPDMKARKQAELEAMHVATWYEKNIRKRKVEDVSQRESYDLESIDPAHPGHIDRYIEVKAHFSVWPVELTDPEKEQAWDLGSNYWLYVVTRTGERYKLYLVQNPTRTDGISFQEHVTPVWCVIGWETMQSFDAPPEAG